MLNSDVKLKARASALASLAMREHSVFDLAEKLLRKDYPAEIVADLVEVLQQEGLLSDFRFAEMYWRSRSSKGYGPIKIRQELELKQVSSDDVNSGMVAAAIDFEPIIIKVYAKKYKDQPVQDFKDKAKRMNYLYRRGFPTDMMSWVELEH
ncbi:regulatory protein RecX [Marinicella sp. W31]|uniref:regulatory protein RecX n=1 Tax=Marinicella sp. W31 TaxID=3023713 RepID=UPI003756F8BE